MTTDNGHQWLIAAAVAGGIWLLGWFLIHVTIEPIRKLFRRTKTNVDDILLTVIRRHLPLWLLALGVEVGARFAPLKPNVLQAIDRGATTVVILSVSLAVAGFLIRLVSSKASPGVDVLPVNSLIRNLIRFIVLTLGLLVILGQMGVEIAPLLTALGVGSLAVALALQPTLTNLFAGINMLLGRQVRVGDFVEMEGGQGGVITDIGWRSTSLEELPGNMYVIPNSRFAEMILKNYNMPTSEHTVAVEVRLAPGADLDRVEQVTQQAARDVQRTSPGAVHDFQPGVVYKALGDSGVVLAVNLRVRDYRGRGAVAHELIKSLYRHYGESGIELSVAPRHASPAAALPSAPAKPPA